MYSCVVDNGGFSEEVAAGGAVWLPGYRQVVHDVCASPTRAVGWPCHSPCHYSSLGEIYPTIVLGLVRTYSSLIPASVSVMFIGSLLAFPYPFFVQFPKLKFTTLFVFRLVCSQFSLIQLSTLLVFE